MIASKQQKKVEHFSDSTQQNEDVDIFAGLTLPVAPSHNIVINQPPQSASDEERISYSPNIDSQIQKSTIEAVSNDIQKVSNQIYLSIWTKIRLLTTLQYSQRRLTRQIFQSQNRILLRMRYQKILLQTYRLNYQTYTQLLKMDIILKVRVYIL